MHALIELRQIWPGCIDQSPIRNKLTCMRMRTDYSVLKHGRLKFECRRVWLKIEAGFRTFDPCKN